MDDKLLDDVGGGGPPRTSTGGQPGSAAAAAVGGRWTDKDEGSGDGEDWPWTKRLQRLQRHPSFGSVEGDQQTTKNGSDSGRQDYFGVRSYLHHFYDHDRNKSVSSSQCKYDWRTKRPQAQCSGLYWWKTMAMFGAGCLLIGVVTIIAGFLTPRRPIVIDQDTNPNRPRLDEAPSFDFRLEICRMIGLTMFCAGGLILAVSLMVPTFCYRSYPPATEDSAQPVIVDTDGEGDQAEPLPIKSAVPATGTLTGVQPAPKVGEAAVISDTLIAYDD